MFFLLLWYVLLQESDEKSRQDAELARLQQDRGEGEEVPLRNTRRGERTRPQRVELSLHEEEEETQESEDSDDGPREMESEGDTASFQNYIQQQQQTEDT